MFFGAQCSLNVTLDVVSCSVGGPQSESTTDSAIDCTERAEPSSLLWCTPSVNLMHQCTQLVFNSVFDIGRLTSV